MRMTCFVLSVVAVARLGLGLQDDAEVVFERENSAWRNGTAGLERVEMWPEVRLRRFLALRGKLDSADDNLSHNQLASLVRSAFSDPIITSPASPRLAPFESAQCSQLTVDQIVHWAAHHSGLRVNSHGANVFDAPPTAVRSRQKRQAAVALCERMYRERVLGVKPVPERDLSEAVEKVQIEKMDEEQARRFAAQIAEAEAAPHVFEPEINPALDRAAKHSIYDLRDLLDVFGVLWSETDTLERLAEIAKTHTALWAHGLTSETTNPNTMSTRAYVVASGAFVATAFVYIWQKQRLRDSKIPLPPSLEPEWLIGHLRSMPPGSDHTYFAKLGKDLNSDIISFTVLGKTTVVLNSATAASDLLDKRSLVYSDRPDMMIITDEWLVDWKKAVSMCPSGPRHRAYRKMMHKFVSKTAAKVYHPYQEAEVRGFLKRILDSAERIEDEFRQASGGIIMRATYGYKVKSADDSFVTLAATANANLMRAVLASNFLVNTIPALKYVPPWMPGAEWKRDALEWRNQKDVMVDETFNWTKRAIQEGTAEPSIVQTLLSDIPESGMSVEDAEDHIKHIAGTMFPAGSETTVASFMIFVLAITLYPEVQAKAQAEIDRAIGLDRLPNMEDQESLPYVNAIIQEVVRWQPVTPLGVPHRSIQDDIYRGYLIPKGSTVIGNIWAITRDSEMYPDPETFDPERFFNKRTPPAPGFGWGRRICPGQYIAEGSLFIAIASMLATFDISKARDENGQEIVPTTKAKENSLVYHPASFKCDIKPRSDHHKSLVVGI